MATDKSMSSLPKPSAPIAIPTGRIRARTVDHLPRHHPPSHSSILPRSPGPQSRADAVPPDPRKTINPKDPLRYVDSLKLQVIRNKRGETLGLKVVDVNSVKPERANVCAHLPIGKENAGLVFDVESAEAMKELYSKASLTMASDRIMGILFAPPRPDAGATFGIRPDHVAWKCHRGFFCNIINPLTDARCATCKQERAFPADALNASHNQIGWLQSVDLHGNEKWVYFDRETLDQLRQGTLPKNFLNSSPPVSWKSGGIDGINPENSRLVSEGSGDVVGIHHGNSPPVSSGTGDVGGK
ncbi:hypothetical protein QSH57_001851 [Fusarium oxysporum f. sp. vasinfectum]|nr:hypothetical protein QSH57_001851 [Fusarium oxysporum f. sp. vasinfectum]